MHDVEVRCSLHNRLTVQFAGDSSTVLVDELGICQGQVRIDVAAINGHFYGFEIKAAADSLKRLDSQVEAYGLVLDYAAVVAAKKHIVEAKQRLPAWWGIYLARYQDKSLVIELVREPQLNPQVDSRALAELLWHQDTLKMLEDRNALRGFRGKPRRMAWDRLCEVYTLDEIRDSVRMRIKERRAERSGSLCG